MSAQLLCLCDLIQFLQIIAEVKTGAPYKVDKVGNVHVSIGKEDFSDEDLKANLEAFMKTIIDNRCNPPCWRAMQAMTYMAIVLFPDNQHVLIRKHQIAPELTCLVCHFFFSRLAGRRESRSPTW